MLRAIINFMRPVHPMQPDIFKKSERRIVSDMLESKDPTELIAALDAGDIKIVQSFGRDYKSTGGEIRICMDIFGAEVKIRGGELLDCRPQSYGLTEPNGQRLYLAIMAAYRGMTSIEFSEEQAHYEEERSAARALAIEKEIKFLREVARVSF